jgi:DNA polymerase-3 subunit epsilon
MLQIKSKEQYLPPNVSAKEISEIPNRCGVYYFIDKKGKVIYVGKAKNLKKRVNSHFSNNKTDEQKQEFLKRIYHVSFQETGTELMAFILENVEIKKLWPKQNSSQKRFEPSYGLYSFEDGKGYLRLCIEKKKKQLKPIYTFNLLSEGYSLLYKMVKEYDLDTEFCYLQKPIISATIPMKTKEKEPVDLYNIKVKNCINNLEKEFSSFAIFDLGLSPDEQSCILIENGKFYGMGYLSNDDSVYEIEDLKSRLTPYPENEYIKKMIEQYVVQYPYKKSVIPTSNHSTAELIFR